LEKGEKGRGYGQKCPFFYLPSLPIQTGEGAGRPWPAAPRGQRQPEIGGNGEGNEGVLLPFLPWVGVLWRGGSTANDGLLAVVAGAALVVGMEGSEERKKWSWRCGVPRRATQGLL
jgi:hypothetical protein